VSVIAKAYDWQYLAHRFIVDGLTLESVSQLPDSPALGTLKNRAAADKWQAQRTAMRERVVTKTREFTVTSEADVSARHVKIAQALQAKALQALQRVDPAALPPSEIRQYLATATDIERKALGMDNKFTLKGVGQLDQLSDAELLALARRAGVLGDSETGGLTA
jgi:hypothetical protein